MELPLRQDCIHGRGLAGTMPSETLASEYCAVLGTILMNVEACGEKEGGWQNAVVLMLLVLLFVELEQCPTD